MNMSADAILLGVLRMGVGDLVWIESEDIDCDLANGNVLIKDLDLEATVRSCLSEHHSSEHYITHRR
jgi:hypothetical protein